MSKKQNLILGATITAGVAGILTSLLFSKKSSKNWVSNLDPLHEENNHDKFLLGSVAGGLAGVLFSILFAPQSGKDLRHSILSHLRTVDKKSAQASQIAKRVKKKVVSSSTNAKKTKKSARKDPTKKRTATKKASVVNLESEAIV